MAIRLRRLPSVPEAGQAHGMDTQMTIGFVLIGLAGVAAGIVGILLPPGERIAAALPLVVGGGVGIVTLAVGTSGTESPDTFEDVFLTASILGFLATAVTLELLWLRAHTDRESRSAT